MSQFSSVLKTFPTLQTKRLTLRQLHIEDAQTYHEQLAALPHVSKWLDSYEAQSVANARNIIRSNNNQFARAKTVLAWGLCNSQGSLIGCVKLFDIQNRSKAELGYWLAQPYWGQGLMTEAVRRVQRFAFDDLDMHRLYASTHPANVASQRVLRRTGFQQEGILRLHGKLKGEWSNAVLFGVLATDVPPAMPPAEVSLD